MPCTSQTAVRVRALNGIAMLSALLPLPSSADLAPARSDATFDLRPFADARTALRNPDKGWFIHYYDDGTENYGTRDGEALSPERALELIPCLDHVYLRLAWSHLEPKEGEYNWRLLDKVVDPFTKAGVGVAFRVTCKETDRSQYYATPKWVADAGARGTMMEDAWEPDYADPVFLEKLDNFHRAFAERYDGRENLVYVDVGSYGDWGEGHTASSSRRDWPWSAVKAHFDIYRRHYKNALIAVSDDFIGSRVTPEGKPEILQYVRDAGWTFRDDSISVKWFIDNLGPQMRSPELFDAVWEKVPTILELEHYQVAVAADTWRGGSVFYDAILRAHATYGGFHGFPELWAAENRYYAAKAGNKLGYWYFIDEVAVRPSAGELSLAVKWRNEGAAKAYSRYDLDVILTDGDGKDLVFRQEAFDNTAFAPGGSATTEHSIRGVASGEYTLSLRMRKGVRPVYVAVDSAHTRKDGACIVGRIAVLSRAERMWYNGVRDVKEESCHSGCDGVDRHERDRRRSHPSR